MPMPEYQNCRGCDERREDVGSHGHCQPCSVKRRGYAKAALTALLSRDQGLATKREELANGAFAYADAMMEAEWKSIS